MTTTSYHVTETSSRIFDFAFAAGSFATMAEALSYAKGIAHKIAEIAPGDGGAHFPFVLGPDGETIPYSILIY